MFASNLQPSCSGGKKEEEEEKKEKEEEEAREKSKNPNQRFGKNIDFFFVKGIILHHFRHPKSIFWYPKLKIL